MQPTRLPSSSARPRAFAMALAAAVACASGCATTSHVMLAPAQPAIAPELVRVYFSPPQGRYREIALLETSSGPFTYGDQRKTDAVLAKLRAEAAKLGANGVLLQGMGVAGRDGRVGVGVGGGSFGGRTRIGAGVGVDISPAQKHAQALAIVVDGPAVEGP